MPCSSPMCFITSCRSAIALCSSVSGPLPRMGRVCCSSILDRPDPYAAPHGRAHGGGVSARNRRGDVYSADEIRDWLQATGWRMIEHTPLVGPASLIVAEKVA